MNYSIRENILSPASQLASPNCSERPAGAVVDLLVIHNISLPPGEFGTGNIDQLFCNRLDPDSHPYFAEIASRKLSSHLLINRQGEVVQYVPFNLKAWHAGESAFCNKSNCNDYSIGIELEGTDFEAFTEAQYNSLVLITNLLLKVYPCLNLDRIVGHNEIAPGRKTDPGPFFEWDRYRGALQQLSDMPLVVDS